MQLQKPAGREMLPALPEPGPTEVEVAEVAEAATLSSGTASHAAIASLPAILQFQENPIFVALPEDACTQPAQPKSREEPNEASCPSTNDSPDRPSAKPDASMQNGCPSAVILSTGEIADPARAIVDPTPPGYDSRSIPPRAPYAVKSDGGAVEKVVESDVGQAGKTEQVQAAIDALRKRADLMGSMLEDCDRMMKPDAMVHIPRPATTPCFPLHWW
jgi:hypothetical protein